MLESVQNVFFCNDQKFATKARKKAKNTVNLYRNCDAPLNIPYFVIFNLFNMFNIRREYTVHGQPQNVTKRGVSGILTPPQSGHSSRFGNKRAIFLM